MVKYNVIVLAAGQGKRMNAGKNKQFIELLNEPLIIHTLKKFIKDSWCQNIYLVINPNEQEQMEELIVSYQWQDQIIFVHGGRERQESGYQGLLAINEEQQDMIVMIHDGARPFVEESQLHELAQAAKGKKAALLAVPVTDTIKRKNGDKIETLDRSTLWAAQTPQAFNYPLIKKAHEQAIASEYLGTDDVSLVEALGEPVDIVQGTYQNVKLTTQEDIVRAEMILERQEEK
ncbi:2-C-methyl-D-erythritol 4-phosphate cytidylyltransferase [Gracilibacillus thailandensis]|jgi:2-C-methyl-D-erythritol 4-phosphate cytidylyltransferase|uniref:2-C-methyl-D-erythritol 4-phosphate cytidylyltransferase n=1 Tax=Gracilibacillus thailandensis TaxID=563735 RepID=A0A6N7QZL2_9BACI|nr:2-C-methyl-D-erythritol 4-phosphate cytidylyltransferase [Gracilibacillus thailandensis]MRI66944.1 2-C-methyl-D-erythritol 4-phosphate cytidylyltransferase [Gracilibacillus thailandensis]